MRGRAALGALAFWLCATPRSAPTETIMQIQGSRHRSPIAGRAVAGVRGVATARAGVGFWLQDPAGDGDPATSDAVFVYTRTPPSVAVGDAVEVAGAVFEYRPGCSRSTTGEDETCAPTSAAFDNATVTELVATDLVVLAHDAALPPPAWIGGTGELPPDSIAPSFGGSIEEPEYPFDRARHALDFLETLEGMRVVVADARVVGPTDAFGVVSIVADAGRGATALSARGSLVQSGPATPGARIALDDALAPTPAADVGDRLGDVEGVLDYRFGSPRLLATHAVVATEASPSPATASAPEPAALGVAAWNVENFAATSSRAKRDALARQIAVGLGGPAIVALAEMQDADGTRDSGSAAGATTFEALVTAIRAVGGPAYRFVQIDPEDGADGGAPGANIRSGFLYDPVRVAFGDGTPHVGDAVTPIGVDSGGALTLDAGRIAPGDAAFAGSRKPLAARFRIGGRTLVAIALHLRSKAGDGPAWGRFQPPRTPSDAPRLAQAEAVSRFVESLLAADPMARVVVLGDCNDPAFAAPLERLEAAGLSNLTRTLPPAERYTYLFEGTAQALDHVLVSASLAGAAGYEIVHADAERLSSLRASDHDAVVGQLPIGAPEPRGVVAGLVALACVGAAARPCRASLRHDSESVATPTP